MGIQINGQIDDISATDGGLTISDLEINQSGISTFNAGVGIGDSIFHLGDDNTQIRFPANDTITAETGGSERLRITSDGKVGIGTDNPSEKLSVENGNIFIRDQIDNQSYIYFTHSPTANRRSYIGAVEGTGNSQSLVFATNGDGLDGAERLRIDPFGRVLIGGTSAIIGSSAEFSEIVLTGKTRGAGITLQDVDANTRFQIRTDDDNSGDPQTLLNASTNHPIVIRTNNTERLRIGSNGLLTVTTTGQSSGIRLIDSSTSSGTPNLEIIGKRSDGNVNTAFSSNIFLGSNRTDQKVTNNKFLGTINFGGNHTDGTIGNISYAAAIAARASGDFNSKSDMPTDLIFTTGTSGTDRDGESANQSNVGTERLRIKSDGNISVTDGNIIMAAGHGIDFSATGNANGTSNSELFHDYEEGTWTPNSGTNMGTLSGTIQGNYIKIGSMCFIQFGFTTSSVSGAHSSRITGLPFTPADNNSSTGVENTGCIFHDNGFYFAWVNGGANEIYIEAAEPIYGNLTTGSQHIRGSLYYHVA
jgi:hypothetical protein